MAKLIAVFGILALVSAAAAATGQSRLVGAPIEASENDEDVQRALVFAVNEYNKGTNDMFVSRVAKINHVEKQIVSGINFIFDVDFSRTLCRKPKADVEQCEFHVEPDLAKTVKCSFVVYHVPWTGHTEVTWKQCS
ncbi:cystatin-like [Pelobates fuscus]|uniref:cystatin-like n=1 Tax=Pelobates fuscus TaxID=191477 RepID=UPI002FE47456